MRMVYFYVSKQQHSTDTSSHFDVLYFYEIVLVYNLPKEQQLKQWQIQDTGFEGAEISTKNLSMSAMVYPRKKAP